MNIENANNDLKIQIQEKKNNQNYETSNFDIIWNCLTFDVYEELNLELPEKILAESKLDTNLENEKFIEKIDEKTNPKIKVNEVAKNDENHQALISFQDKKITQKTPAYSTQELSKQKIKSVVNKKFLLQVEQQIMEIERDQLELIDQNKGNEWPSDSEEDLISYKQNENDQKINVKKSNLVKIGAADKKKESISKNKTDSKNSINKNDDKNSKVESKNQTKKEIQVQEINDKRDKWSSNFQNRKKKLQNHPKIDDIVELTKTNEASKFILELGALKSASINPKQIGKHEDSRENSNRELKLQHRQKLCKARKETNEISNKVINIIQAKYEAKTRMLSEQIMIGKKEKENAVFEEIRNKSKPYNPEEIVL